MGDLKDPKVSGLLPTGRLHSQRQHDNVVRVLAPHVAHRGPAAAAEPA
jgi:hypothetical protein